MATPQSHDYEQLNRRSIQELIVFLDFANNLTIGFVEINWKQDATLLLQILERHPDCDALQFLHLSFEQSDLIDLLSEIEVALQQTSIKPDKKLVITLSGLENAIGLVDDYPPFLTDLNFVRDSYKQDMPYPILFLLPSNVLTRLATFAPDFWAWRSGVFSFQATPQTLQSVSSDLRQVQWPDSLLQPEKQDRIELLTELLHDYQNSKTLTEVAQAFAQSEVLVQLGDAYLSQGQVEPAMTNYFSALSYAKQIADRLKQGIALQKLGQVYILLGNYTQAKISLQQSLAITQEIGDRANESLTLSYLGNMHDASGQHTEAIACHEQALHIADDLGNQWQQGINFGNLGVSHYYLGEYTRAIEYQLQALDIASQFGDRRRMGMVLSQLGRAYNALGQYQKALEPFQKALAIVRDIGDRRGESLLLESLSSSYYYLGQSGKAKELYDHAEQIGQDLNLEPLGQWL